MSCKIQLLEIDMATTHEFYKGEVSRCHFLYFGESKAENIYCKIVTLYKPRSGTRAFVLEILHLVQM